MYTRQQLLKMCKEKKLHNYFTLSKDDLCSLLEIPLTAKNEKYEKSCRGIRVRPKEVVLVKVTSFEKKTFKSIYSAAKAIGKNPGSVLYAINTKKTLKSKLNNCEYRIEI